MSDSTGAGYRRIRMFQCGQWSGVFKDRHLIYGISVIRSGDGEFHIYGLDMPHLMCPEEMGFGRLQREDAVALRDALTELLNEQTVPKDQVPS